MKLATLFWRRLSMAALHNGVYDLLIKIRGNSIEKLKEITKFRIKPIAGVNSSLTMMIVQGN
jgi:DNA-binding Lrp family transcriptional regulator